MTTYLSVGMGVDMSQAWAIEAKPGRDGRTPAPTKAWLREYLRTHPQKDFRNLGFGGSYVNGQDAMREDLTLQFNCRSGTALINFQPVEKSDANPWGYQAVVR